MSALRGEGSRGHARATRLLLVFAGLGGCASAGPVEEAGQPVPARYTAQQADRGQDVFGSVCSSCHSRNEFTGPIFELTWMAEPVGNLFQHIRANMPYDEPGSLSAEQYAAVVAYMLRLNGRPAGELELPADPDSLARMRW